MWVGSIKLQSASKHELLLSALATERLQQKGQRNAILLELKMEEKDC
jgi:hypothetical protein